MTSVARLQALLEEGVRTGVFPSAAAVVFQDGQAVFSGGAGGASSGTVFDLASLTKVLATTPVFATLWRDGVVAPDTPVARLLPGAAVGRAGVTLADLLAHRSGLPGYAPLFAPVLRATPALLAADCPSRVRILAREDAVARALAVPPEAPPRARALYSDVGFVVAGEALAVAAGVPLDAAFRARVAGPLGLGLAFRRLSSLPPQSAPRPDRDRIPSTGRTRPREPAPGQEGLWTPFPPHPTREGEADDDNAWVMDGVAGHAGLFGTADEVARAGHAILEEREGAGRLGPAAAWARILARDSATPGSTRALGFNTRQPGDPLVGSPGRRLGDRWPGAVGHTGYTGTSLWIDLARRVAVALCTNRTGGPAGRAETRINDFRPRFHDAAIEALDAS